MTYMHTTIQRRTRFLRRWLVIPFIKTNLYNCFACVRYLYFQMTMIALVTSRRKITMIQEYRRYHDLVYVELLNRQLRKVLVRDFRKFLYSKIILSLVMKLDAKKYIIDENNLRNYHFRFSKAVFPWKISRLFTFVWRNILTGIPDSFAGCQWTNKSGLRGMYGTRFMGKIFSFPASSCHDPRFGSNIQLPNLPGSAWHPSVSSLRNLVKSGHQAVPLFLWFDHEPSHPFF